jgi:hypothetical protein
LYGNDGKDVLFGGLGIDRIYSGENNDLLAAWDYGDEGAAELFDGEGGLDLLSYATVISGRGLFYEHLNQRNGLPRMDQFDASGGGSVVIRAGDGEVDRILSCRAGLAHM